MCFDRHIISAQINNICTTMLGREIAILLHNGINQFFVGMVTQNSQPVHWCYSRGGRGSLTFTTKPKNVKVKDKRQFYPCNYITRTYSFTLHQQCYVLIKFMWIFLTSKFKKKFQIHVYSAMLL